MERRSIAHIAIVASIVALAGVAEGTAWSKNATTARNAPAAAGSHTYVVRNGDGWWQIAHAHNTTLPKLLAANHATAATPVNAGQKIKLPADAKVDTKPAAKAPAQAKHAAMPATAPAAAKPKAR